MKRLSPQIKRHHGTLIIMIIALIVNSLIGLVSPMVTGNIIDALPQKDLSRIVFFVLLLLLSSVAQSFIGYLQSKKATEFAQSFGIDLRLALAAKLRHAELSEFTVRPIGELTNRVDSDVQSVVAVFLTILPSAVSALSLVWMLIILPILNWRLALVPYFFIPLWFLSLLVSAEKISTTTKSISEARDKFDTVLTEDLSFRGILRVKMFGMYAKDAQRMHSALSDVASLFFKKLRLSFPINLFQTLISAGAAGSVLLLGSWLIIRGELSIGVLVAFLGLMSRTFAPIGAIANMQLQMVSLTGIFDRFFELFDLASETSGENAPGVPFVVFKNISFSYGSKQVLDQVTATIPRGSRVALMGPSGVGKTTLAYLLMRLYKPTSGDIYLGGQPIETIDLESFRRTVNYVPQEHGLFTGTIRQNLIYGCEDVSADEINNVLNICALSTFIKDLPAGLESFVGTEGSMLSGGQRQRLVLARALLTGPKILILDEATSAMDHDTEEYVLASIEKELPETTIILISHRRPTIAREVIFLGGSTRPSAGACVLSG